MSRTILNTDADWFSPIRATRQVARRFGSLLISLPVIAVLCAPVAAQSIEQGTVINREYSIKAAFLYNFLKYVEWPDDGIHQAEQPFVIGVFKTDPFGDVLDQLAGSRPVAGRSIAVRRLDSMDNLLECHILFIPRSVSRTTQDAVIRAVRGSHVLTVGESDDFVDRGGAAQFFLEGNKVRFAFNTDVVGREKLRVSSKLLSLAKIVSTQ